VTGAGEERLLYIYGVVDAAPAEPGLGLDDAPLGAVASGSLVAVVSEHARPPEADEDGFWRHEAVVERLMKSGAVLPLRFGTTVADEAAVRDFLRAREGEFTRQLDAVRGAVELAVRAELPSAAPVPVPSGTPSSGTEYMRERGRLLRVRDRAREVLHESLTALSRRSVLLAGGGDAAFKGAYLVDGERVPSFAELVDRLGRELEVEVSCTGPWPPYSFVGGDDA
jgi:hypothetical protein